MRLLKYFLCSSMDEQTNKFRCLNIKLVKEEDTSLLESIEHVKKKYDLDDDILALTEQLNSRLKNYYKGQYRFGFTIDECFPLNRIKIPSKVETKIRTQLFESNDILAKIKRRIETEN